MRGAFEGLEVSRVGHARSSAQCRRLARIKHSWGALQKLGHPLRDLCGRDIELGGKFGQRPQGSPEERALQMCREKRPPELLRSARHASVDACAIDQRLDQSEH
jgi:hypothetical protein